ncbi:MULTISPECIES: hypothetical protein [Chitinophaga]|nr:MULTISPECIES: hypothetical protein [Chitinophaga]
MNEYLNAVALYCVKDVLGKIQGFIGIAGDKVAMLFIDPDGGGE